MDREEVGAQRQLYHTLNSDREKYDMTITIFLHFDRVFLEMHSIAEAFQSINI